MKNARELTLKKKEIAAEMHEVANKVVTKEQSVA